MRRKRFTRAFRPIRGAMILTESQWRALKVFYRDDLDAGPPCLPVPEPTKLRRNDYGKAQ